MHGIGVADTTMITEYINSFNLSMHTVVGYLQLFSYTNS